MISARKLVAAVILGGLLCGCSYVDRLTGETDNTVLPGAREDAVPGRSQFPDPSERAQTASAPGGDSQPGTPDANCPPEEPTCGASTGDVFSDPQ